MTIIDVPKLTAANAARWRAIQQLKGANDNIEARLARIERKLAR